MAPRLFHTHTGDYSGGLRRPEDLRGGRAHLGRLRGHEFYVSFDEIGADDFLQGLRAERNGLVASHFLTSDRTDSRTGELGRAVRQRLREVDSEAEEKLRQQLEQLPSREPGVVIPISCRARPGFPVHALYLVLLGEDDAKDAREKALTKGLTKTFRQAGVDGIDNLVIPALGIDGKSGELPFLEFLASTFAATPEGGAPRAAYLSWYPNWPTKALEAAGRAIEDLHGPTFSFAYGVSDKLEHPVLRVYCIALAACLFCVSRVAQLNAKRFLVISTSYLGAATGTWWLVSLLTTGRSADFTFAAQCIMLLVAAVAFRWTVHYDASKEVPKKGAGR